LTVRAGSASIWLAILVAISAAWPMVAGSEEHPRSAAFCLKRGWTRNAESLAVWLQVPLNSTVVASGDGRIAVVPNPSGGPVVGAELASGDSLVAFTIEGKMFQVVVTTIDGSERARFASTIGSHWCPWAPILAVMNARPAEEGEEGPQSLGINVWDAATGKSREYPIRAFELGWVAVDTLVVDDTMTFRDLVLSTGEATPSRYRGTIISPDGRYSVFVSPEGAEEVWDVQRRTSMTRRVLAAAHVSVLTSDPTRYPFWVRSGRPHDLVIPGTGGKVVIVDVGKMEKRATIPGDFLGPTSDASGIAVSTRTEVRVVAVEP
jgi:hypothetical protein